MTKPTNTLSNYDRLKSAIGRGLGCACELCCEDIEIEIAALKRDAERWRMLMKINPAKDVVLRQVDNRIERERRAEE